MIFLFMFRFYYDFPSASADGALRGESNITHQTLPQPRKTPIPRVQNSSHIKPSPFRPHVLAKNRLQSWSTPYSKSVFEDLRNHFAAETIDKWRSVMLASVEGDSLQNYGAGLLRFNQFCDNHGIPESSRMPASETLLSIFVSEMGAGKVSRGTVNSWLSGLAFWHQINNAPWHGGSILARTKKGASNTSLRSIPHLPKRLPVTEAHMKALRCRLHLSEPKDAAIWASATCAWHGCNRLAELFPKRRFDARYHVSKGAPRKLGRAANGRRWMRLFIPWSKTTKFEGKHVDSITFSSYGYLYR